MWHFDKCRPRRAYAAFFKLRNSKWCSVSSLTFRGKTLIRLRVCAGWSEALLVTLFEISWHGSFFHEVQTSDRKWKRDCIVAMLYFCIKFHEPFVFILLFCLFLLDPFGIFSPSKYLFKIMNVIIWIKFNIVTKLFWYLNFCCIFSVRIKTFSVLRFQITCDEEREAIPYPEAVMSAKDGIHLHFKDL